MVALVTGSTDQVSWNMRPRIERGHYALPALFLICGLSLFFASLFCVPRHDLDIDAFLYLGSRLAHGELLYTRDFETKLPFVQYLFLPASLAGGVGAWRLMSFAVVVVCGVPAAYLLARHVTRRIQRPDHEIAVAGFGFSLFLVLIYALPGSMDGLIEMMAAAGAFLSSALIVTRNDRATPFTRIVLSAVFLSFSAMIRPNYFYTVLPALLVLLADRNQDWVKRLWSVVVFSIAFWILPVLTLLPYLMIPNGLTAAVDGVTALAFFSSGTSLGRLLGYQSDYEVAWLYLGLAGLAVTGLISLFSTKNGGAVPAETTFLAVASAAMLEFSIVRTHYWPHNTIMFVPCLVILAVTQCCRYGRGSFFFWSGTWRDKAVAVPLALFITGGTLAILFFKATTFNPRINDRQIDHDLLAYLAAAQKGGKSFYLANSALYHFLLNEPRIGDGHPAMLAMMLEGKQIGPVSDIPLYDKSQNPCGALYTSGKDLIIVETDSWMSQRLLDCFPAENAVYRRIAGPPGYDVMSRGTN